MIMNVSDKRSIEEDFDRKIKKDKPKMMKSFINKKFRDQGLWLERPPYYSAKRKKFWAIL